VKSCGGGAILFSAMKNEFLFLKSASKCSVFYPWVQILEAIKFSVSISKKNLSLQKKNLAKIFAPRLKLFLDIFFEKIIDSKKTVNQQKGKK
jgi:hypothetical protein